MHVRVVQGLLVASVVAGITLDGAAKGQHPAAPAAQQGPANPAPKPAGEQKPSAAPTQKPNRPKPENQPGAVMDAAKLAASHADHHEMPTLEGGGVLPAGWRHRFDLPTMQLAHLRFLKEGATLHITSGPPGILYDPSVTASADFVVKGIFTQLAKGEHREGYGPFIGGADLEADTQRYTYFLVRQDGRFLIKERLGAKTRGQVDWTPHPAITPFGEDGRMTNELSIVAAGETVSFLINGTEVARKPRKDVPTDGIVGLRVNHQLDIRVENLTIER